MSIERDAIRILAERGWHKGGLQHVDGMVCTVGALALAAGRTLLGGEFISGGTGDTEGYFQAYGRVNDVVVAQFRDRAGSNPLASGIPDFNDHDDTTIDDVLLVLEKAAVLAEEQAG